MKKGVHLIVRKTQYVSGHLGPIFWPGIYCQLQVSRDLPPGFTGAWADALKLCAGEPIRFGFGFGQAVMTQREAARECRSQPCWTAVQTASDAEAGTLRQTCGLEEAETLL